MSIETKPLTSGIYRFLTTPYHGRKHILGGAYHIGCAWTSKYDDIKCRVCLDGDKPFPTCLIGAIDRSNGNQYMVFRLTNQQFRNIQNIAMNPSFGDPKRFDIEIDVERGRAASVINSNPLSVTESGMIIDEAFLKEQVAPWPLDRVNVAYKRWKEVLSVLE